MGNRGFRAGGYDYMRRQRCDVCGRDFAVGVRNRRVTCGRCVREGHEIHVADVDPPFRPWRKV